MDNSIFNNKYLLCSPMIRGAYNDGWDCAAGSQFNLDDCPYVHLNLKAAWYVGFIEHRVTAADPAVRNGITLDISSARDAAFIESLFPGGYRSIGDTLYRQHP
jgi:hypothetical protein